MADNEHYVGDGARRYLEQRSGAQGDHVQGLRASLFADLGRAGLTVLDFGCGTGGVLSRVAAARRIGVEVSAPAAERARASGLEIFERLEDLPDQAVDVAISFHAIEHVDDPLHVLRQLRRVVKPSGCVRLVVPCETPVLALQRFWRPNADRHLYTWTPLLFGNLADRAGFADITARVSPMPTQSRLVRLWRWLPPVARLVHVGLGVRRNALNVILDARVP